MDSIKTKVNKLIEYGKNQLQSKGVDSTASDLRGVLDGISDIQQGGAGGDLLNVIKGLNSYQTTNYPFELTEDMFDENSTVIGQYQYAYNSNIIKVTIPNNINRICGYSFECCYNLTNVIINGNNTVIEVYALYWCKGLKSVIFKGIIKSLDNYVFYGQYNLLDIIDWREVTAIPTVQSNSFYNVPTTCKFIIPDELYDSWITATNWASLYAKGYQFIKVSDFYGTDGLTYTLNEDGESYTCSGVGYATDTVISIGQVYDYKPVTVIGRNAFLSYNLTNVNIPNSIKSIEYQAFSNCPNLVSVIIPDSVTSIGIRAFSVCSSLESATIGNSVTSIGQYAFSNCSSLTSITIPNSVNSIGSSAFWQCSSLTSITIPDSVTSIGEYAFYYCTSLTSITIPNSLTSIGSYTFDGCNSLTSITIGNSVTSIGDRAFNECTALQVVDFRSATQVPTVQSGSFTNVPTTCKFIIPDSLYDSWITATNWTAYENQIIKSSEYVEE